MTGEPFEWAGDEDETSRYQIVTSVERKGSESRQVCLDDGSFFLLSDEQCLNLGVREGVEISIVALRDAHEAHEAARALEKGASLIAARDHARRELERKLVQRGFSASAIEHALSRLEEYGYLDDARFAEAYIRERLRRHPEGRMALAAGLSKRGVERSVAERVLDEIVEGEVELDALDRAARKLSSDGREANKLSAALLRRGFAPASVRAWIRDHEI
mgnify:CR=1 FL=1